MPLLLKALIQPVNKYMNQLEEKKKVWYNISSLMFFFSFSRLNQGERLSSLDGVIFAAKDNLCISEGSTTCASRFLASILNIHIEH